MKKAKLIVAFCLAASIGYSQSYGAGGQTPNSASGKGKEGTDSPLIPATPLIRPFAGTSYGFSGDGGQATAAQLKGPVAVTFDASGNMYIADQTNDRIRKVTTAGVISTFAGNGSHGYGGDGGQASAAVLYWPQGMAFDASGNLYIAEYGHRIRKITTGGVISTYCGNGSPGFSGDGGQASAAQVNMPANIKFDASGNMIFADWGNHCVRKINTSGVISTIAGTGGSAGYTGDGGQATAALLHAPWGVAFDGSGNLYIGDEDNNVVRQVNTSGVISTYAGNGLAGYSGDGGMATAAKLNQPVGVEVDASGNLFIADRNNAAVRRVIPSGAIATMAGTGSNGLSGDCGYAGSALLWSPTCGIDKDALGRMYISDCGNTRVRQLMFTCYADAGPNQTNHQDICGSWLPGVTIGTPSLTCLSYTWSPSTNLSPTNSATATSTYSTTLSSQTITYTLTVTGTGCTTATSTVNVTAVKNTCSGCCREASPNSSIPVTATEFALYPNPGHDQMTLSLNGAAAHVQILNLQGKLVYELKDMDQGDHTLDLSKYPKGIYFLIAQIGDKLEKQKFVVH